MARSPGRRVPVVSSLTAGRDTRPAAVRSRGAQLLEEQLDERQATTRCLPCVPDALVVDETARVGRNRDRLGRGGGERCRLELVAVRGEALESIPEGREGAPLPTEGEERVRRLLVGVAVGERCEHRVPQVVVGEPGGRAEPADWVEAPLEGDTSRSGVGQPRLRAVHEAVDGHTEPPVEEREQTSVRVPHAGRGTWHGPQGTGASSAGRRRLTGVASCSVTYERLSALDASFLHLERPQTPMQVGAVAIFEGAPFHDAAGRFRLDDVRALVGSRLHLVPRLRRRLMDVPLGADHPVWVDDERFTLERHVKLTALPPPCDRRRLLELAERLMAQPLDRSRPLWELWFVDGVDGGRHVGVVHKSHHALADGISGVDLATVLLDFSREHVDAQAPPWRPESPPDPARLFLDSVSLRMAASRDLVRSAGTVTTTPQQVAVTARRLARSFASIADGGALAPRSSLNDEVGMGRRLEVCRVELETAKLIRRAFECTVNDVVLATVGGALARVLARRGELRDDLVLKVVCPVSVRDESDRGKLGNQLSFLFVPLPIGGCDAAQRLRAVRSATVGLKEREQAIGAAALLSLSEYAAPTMLGVAARAAHAQPLANLMVTNVPGPQVPLYCLGAEMLDVYPIVPLSKNLTLNVAVMSYRGWLHFGLLSDRKSGRDLEILAGGLEDAYDELARAAAATRRTGVGTPSAASGRRE
jgi:diacylglycerol O-acyltransferase / wax synthase